MIIPARIEVTFVFSNDTVLNFNYQHSLMGMVYKMVADRDLGLALRIHSDRNPKVFTFSWLRGKPSKVGNMGLFYRKGTKVKFIFSSWIDEIINAFSTSLLNSQYVLVNSSKFFVESLRIYEEDPGSKAKFILLSPIVVSKGVKMKDKVYHEFLSPENGEFFQRIVENLKKRYSMYVGKEPGDVRIIPDEDYLSKKRTSKLVDIRGTKIRGHVFPFEVNGDEDLIRFGYYAGFGERTAQGFGCAEITRR